MRHAARRLPLLAVALAAISAPTRANDLVSQGSETPSNPGLATGATTASGAAAPAGAQWSEMPSDIGGNAAALAGVAAHPEAPFASFRVADTLIVPPGSRWTVSTISFYAYQPGAGAAPPFASGTISVWRGRPGAANSTVVFGDTTTNRLASPTRMNLYRIFNTSGLPPGAGADLSRSLWRVDFSLPSVALGPGVYWLDVGLSPAQAGGQAFLATVKPARVKSANESAVQLRPAPGGSAWATLGESHIFPFSPPNPVGVAYIVRGTAAPSCVNFIDLNVLLAAIPSTPNSANWDPLYDLNGDGEINTEDLIALLSMYGSGCS